MMDGLWKLYAKLHLLTCLDSSTISELTKPCRNRTSPSRSPTEEDKLIPGLTRQLYKQQFLLYSIWSNYNFQLRWGHTPVNSSEWTSQLYECDGWAKCLKQVFSSSSERQMHGPWALSSRLAPCRMTQQIRKCSAGTHSHAWPVNQAAAPGLQ